MHPASCSSSSVRGSRVPRRATTKSTTLSVAPSAAIAARSQRIAPAASNCRYPSAASRSRNCPMKNGLPTSCREQRGEAVAALRCVAQSVCDQLTNIGQGQRFELDALDGDGSLEPLEHASKRVRRVDL